MNREPFDEILARYSSPFQPRTPIDSLGGGGGFSGARLWRYGSDCGPLVLRAWPSDGPGREHLERVHRWLFQTAELPFIPVPIRDRAGRSLQDYDGGLWEITHWLPGKADLAQPPPLPRLRASFSGLAAFHERLAFERTETASPGLGKRYDAVTQLIGGEIEALAVAVARGRGIGAGSPDAARRWLSLARIVAPLLVDSLLRASALVSSLQPCLRDARAEHFLFEDEQLTGLVDFGAMGVDSVAGDLARLIGEWFNGDTKARGDALAAYERIRPLQPAEIILVGVFESSADLLIGERWIRWHYLEGRRFDDPHAVSNGLARGLKRLERLASELTRSSVAG